ncbi:phosphonate ABC transporter substrate-binding protein [Laceyella putida]|uniref:Phosphonate ABC transporter substrate-binding protein n=1 Tax=Laceyella putida TaxID=110101 RepID=A0ABW2RQH5_9BACL
MKRLGIIFLSCFIVVMALVGCQSLMGVAESNKVLRMGIIPHEDPKELEDKYEELVKYLETELNVQVKIYVAPDYDGVIEAMRERKIDFALFGPLSYVQAEKEVGAVPIVVENQADSGGGYHSIIVTRKDSGLTSLQALKGKSFAFVDRGSTSGYLMPTAYMQRYHIDPSRFFGKVTYAGGHDAVGQMVYNKQVDAGAMNDVTYRKLVNEGKLNPDQLQIIWTSSLIPGAPIAVHPQLDKELKEKLADALTLADEKDPEVLEELGIAKYERTDRAFYKPVRDAMQLLNLQ